MNGFVWLVSYPKSGNTWMRFLLDSVLRGGAAVDINRPELPTFSSFNRAGLDDMLGVNTADLTEAECDEFRGEAYRMVAEEATSAIFSKVHERWARSLGGRTIFPPEAGNRGIYLVRDPRDVACSLANHLGYSLDATIDFMEDPDAGLAVTDNCRGSGQIVQRLGVWSDHVTSWLDQTDIAMHCIRYEDLLADTVGTLATMFAFLGMEVEREVLRKASEATRFETLREAERSVGFRERPSSSPQFFRSGRAERWREELTAGQAGRLQREHGAVMARLGYVPE
ncbi:sulfotransferase domain-containing protein [Endothiovibrio diazotrophicus]